MGNVKPCSTNENVLPLLKGKRPLLNKKPLGDVCDPLLFLLISNESSN